MGIAVGFIGLGTMGSAMALRIAQSDHKLLVWNRTAGKADELVSAGARETSTPTEVFERSDIVLSMLANDAAADAAFSEDALQRGSGTLHVNMATISLAMCRELAERHREHGVGYIAAPVLGRPDVAAAGQLNIVAAGEEALVDRAEPILSLLGKQVWRVGDDPAQASLVKIGVNYNLIHALQALGESLSLVEHGGVDSRTFVDILTDTAFTGSAYRGYGGIIAQRSYHPAGFPVALGLKDLRLATAAAAELGAALPTAPVMNEVFDAALADPDLRDADWSAIAEIIRRAE
ncbi:NAD(P)-dependent oxidoreductase [Leucobacter tenebrionis]|uniref:NAD(P)-dependent oxidoreductase n=1 Tax=Leucobacter tenebrionis TaxID=2873270 RepID=UPI001CA62B6A|nr:NAD(P)-dependent oxidoreductase [Leucobacter tenebrionis]QZY50723.1 NAD(P)-dependent oxidoreductase [Leucobacter tenebrionis]